MSEQKGFRFPKFYKFPPFFTLQPVQQTRAKQMAIWVDLVKDYQRYHNRTSIDVAKAANSKLDLFFNKEIKRSLSEKDIRTVLDEFCKQGFGAWTDKTSRAVCLTSHRKMAEWATELYRWAKEAGMVDRICTLNEIRTEDSKAAFYNLDPLILHEALQILKEDGRASLFPGETLDELGVKMHDR
jgi:ESCRT-II complex subunit VPS25